VAFTVTVKLVDPLPVFPAMSVAVADNGFVPTRNEDAGPDTFWQVVDATPESVSATDRNDLQAGQPRDHSVGQRQSELRGCTCRLDLLERQHREAGDGTRDRKARLGAEEPQRRYQADREERHDERGASQTAPGRSGNLERGGLRLVRRGQQRLGREITTLYDRGRGRLAVRRQPLQRGRRSRLLPIVGRHGLAGNAPDIGDETIPPARYRDDETVIVTRRRSAGGPRCTA
jgi:hypothetical protein